MAKKTPPIPSTADVQDYRHDARRKNNPPAGIAGRGTVEKLRKQVYEYDAHLPPVLRFDQTGKADQVPALIDSALGVSLREAKPPRTEEDLQRLENELRDLVGRALNTALKKPELQCLVEALRRGEPWLEWSGKREKKRVEVDPVALHIHERVSARAILQVAAKQTPQRSLFADPVQSYREAVQFYQHEVGWANRLILGDSLAVMSSLAVRENLAGKVQMIYMDPPYGIRFSSNFQPVVGDRDVKDQESDLTREPEVVKAYRDTWELGVHTYLSYLRDRLRVARDLLTEAGSVFVQIGDENVHRVRTVMDEVFGPTNYVLLIAYKRLGTMIGERMQSSAHYLLWYAKNKPAMRHRKVFLEQEAGVGTGDHYTQLWDPTSGSQRAMMKEERAGRRPAPAPLRPFQLVSLATGNFRPTSTIDYVFRGARYHPGQNKHWRAVREGLDRLTGAERIEKAGATIRFKQFLRDFPLTEVGSIWEDTGRDPENYYVVQTPTNIIRRCMLMTTNPGDLVLDPTCGSGTSAFVAENWGRRWIAIDSSRVAIFLARQRLLTATFEYYRLKDKAKGVSGGFNNTQVPHIELQTIARCKALDPILDKHAPILASYLASLNAALSSVTPQLRQTLEYKLHAKARTKNADDPVTEADERRWLLPKVGWEAWEVPFDIDPDWPKTLQDALVAYRAAWREKMDEANACIDRSADQEELVDQPDVDQKILRVSGPFTVEGVEPAALTLDEPSPIEPPDGNLPLFAGEAVGPGFSTEAANIDAYIEKMLRLLKADGIRFMNNKQVHFDRLDRRTGSILHAEGEWVAGEGEPRRVAISIGPQYGPVTAKAVDQAIHAAARAGFDDLVMAGFAFDAEATGRIEDDSDPVIRTHLAHIRPDVQMEDLLKDSPSSQIFTVFGSPRSRIEEVGTGEYVAHMEGMDVYDPVANALLPTGADKVAAWFLDIDYDGRTFCISQAFFPDRSAWDKLARALKGTVEEDAFEQFSGKASMRFSPGPNRRVAVKVIDPRGNEVMRVHDLPAAR